MQLQPIASTHKSSISSFLITTMAGIMLKTYMAMSHLWLLADKIKKANDPSHTAKTHQPILKTQM